MIVGVLIAAWDGWRGNVYRLAVRSTIAVSGSGWRSSVPARSACVARERAESLPWLDMRTWSPLRSGRPPDIHRTTRLADAFATYGPGQPRRQTPDWLAIALRWQAVALPLRRSLIGRSSHGSTAWSASCRVVGSGASPGRDVAA